MGKTRKIGLSLVLLAAMVSGAGQASALPKNKNADCTQTEQRCNEIIQHAEYVCANVERDLVTADQIKRNVIRQSYIFRRCAEARRNADACKKKVIACHQKQLDAVTRRNMQQR